MNRHGYTQLPLFDSGGGRVKSYTGVLISSAIYCSSSGDYFATIAPLGRSGQFQDRQYHINSQCIIIGEQMINRPLYLIDMIIQALRSKTDLRIYEHDREGQRRFAPLRYGDMDELRRFVQRERIPTTHEHQHSHRQPNRG